MASSLDDRPEYEALQEELDRTARAWVVKKSYPPPVLKLLEQYIEYLCSDLLLDRNTLFTEALAEEYIQKQDLSVWEFSGGLEATGIVREFTLRLKAKA